METSLIGLFSFVASFVLFGIIPGFGPALFFFRKRTLSISDKILLSLLLSPLVLVTLSATEDLLGIPQWKPILLINLAAVGGFSLYAYRAWHREQPGEKLPESDGRANRLRTLILVGFALVLLARVFPATLSPTPITADPIAHAEWLFALNTTGHTTDEQWYPQGVAYFLNYFVSFVPLSTPKAVLLSTNYFSALFPIALSLLVLLSSKMPMPRRLLFAFLTFVIASLTPFPKEFYYTSGKNAFIFALAAAPIIFLLVSRTRTHAEHFLLSVLAFAVFMLHFPTGIMVYIVMTAFLAQGIFPSTQKNHRFRKEGVASLLSFAIPTALFLGLIGAHIAPIYRIHPPTEDRSMTAAARSIAQPIPYFAQNLWLSQQAIFEYKPCFTIRLLTDRNVCKRFGFDKDTTTIGFFLLFPIAFLWYLFRRENPVINRILVGYAIAAIVVVATLSLPDKVPGFFLFTEYQLFFTPLFALILAWSVLALFDFVSKHLPTRTLALFIVIFSAIFLVGNIEAAHTYLKKQERVSTGNADLKAFEFIKHLPNDNRRILVPLYNVDDKIIAGADSGIWIPSFTGRAIEVSWLDFSKNESFEIHRLFKTLVKNPNDSAAIEELVCDYGIGYLFQGSRNQRKAHAIRAIENEAFTLIYDQGAKIYRVDGISCSEE